MKNLFIIFLVIFLAVVSLVAGITSKETQMLVDMEKSFCLDPTRPKIEEYILQSAEKRYRCVKR